MCRYPTKKNLKNNEEKNKNESSKLLNSSSEIESARIANLELHDSPKISELPIVNDKTDFVKSNKDRNSIASKIAAQLNNGVVPTNYRKGVVPKYDVKSNFPEVLCLI